MTTKQTGRYIFSHVCSIRPVMDSAGAIAQFTPQHLFTKRVDLSLHTYGGGPFCRFRIPNHYRQAGVYVLSLGDEVKYIGECQNLSSRYNAGYGLISPRNCYQGGQPTNCRVNNLIYQATIIGQEVELWFFQTDNRKVVEVELIRQLQPKWNRKSLLL